MVNHAALVTAVHEQPVPIRNETVPAPAAEVKLWLLGVIDGLHVVENEKVFETSLIELPSGPTAETRASYTTPGTGAEFSNETNPTRILPSGSGAGLPRPTV